MYICIYIYLYIYFCIHTRLYYLQNIDRARWGRCDVYTYIYTRIHIRMHLENDQYVYVLIRIYVYICKYIYVYTHIYVCIPLYLPTFIFAYIHIYVPTYICTCLCIYICVSICMCMYSWLTEKCIRASKNKTGPAKLDSRQIRKTQEIPLWWESYNAPSWSLDLCGRIWVVFGDEI